MDVLILHYHLNPGGVTRIIESQIQSIHLNDSSFPVKIVYGSSSATPELKNTDIVQTGLFNYVDNAVSGEDLNKNLSDVLFLIRSCLKNSTIVHSHNPNLGKNPALTVAMHKIASEGTPVVNHCHDFPEDRPANMQLLERVIPGMSTETVERILYPRFQNYHYIVLNSCDYKRLLDKGILRRQIHLLPNPVPETKTAGINKGALREKVCSQLKINSSEILCTYPVRAIERKNIGEFILMSVLFSETANFAITLAPLNPVEIPAYERWKDFCRRNYLKIRFEAGERVNFKELISASDFCLTTSVREGFGMIYLEPWLLGTPVIGRELSCVIGDLKKQGLKFPRLYDKMEVPLGDRTQDFKDLSQDEQEIVISEAVRNPQSRNKIKAANGFLSSWLNNIPGDVIENNQKIIRQKFSLEEYGKQILGIYSEISR
ncbi:MAG TPA: glycosyltransferase family 4 protein [Bacteroidales bacterium]|jgi:hypothetical protein|nr:glycosyltransferase family 4 protein [Bacteroidales bacterium]